MEKTLPQPRTDSRSANAAAKTSRFSGKRIHFIGIGGCGMSGLAQMLLDDGAIISGSEPKLSDVTQKLSAHGVTLSDQQNGSLIQRSTDLVVRSAAVKDGNPEYIAAINAGVCVMKYAELLGEVMAERFGVAVAGTHGKSTTTAMIAYALLHCSADPSFVIGGTVPQLGGGSRSGASDRFIAEACEFDRSFHHLRPKVALITNIEEDHLDCYKNLDEIIESFRTFAQLVPADGKIIAGGGDPNIQAALRDLDLPIELCSLKPGFAWSTEVIGIERGCYRGIVFHNGTKVAELKLSVAGAHNLINATMAVAACHACGVEPAKSAAALASFSGVDRRLTEVGTWNGATIVDDYGHHPTEIRATLKAVREKYQPRKLFCVFQPHQHSRTRFLLDDFAASFALADETILPDIYFVRDSEAEKHLVSTDDLVSRIHRRGQHAIHVPQFGQIVEYLKANAAEGDLVLTMGAGNVWEIGRDLAA